MLRLFVGIPLPRYLQEALDALTSAAAPHIVWAPLDHRHLTLKFIGEVDPSRQESIIAALFGLPVQPFLLPVQGVGVFPPRRTPRVLWAGLGSAHPRLFQLQRLIDQALMPLGIAPDERVYEPHITLARCQTGADETVRQWLKAHRDFAAPPFFVRCYTLYHSRPSLQGRQYLPLHTFPLPPDSPPDPPSP